MIDLKPYGAFIEHTIRPLLDEVRLLFSELKTYGVNLDEQKLENILRTACRFHFQHMALNFLTQFICTGLLCLTVYKMTCMISR